MSLIATLEPRGLRPPPPPPQTHREERPRLPTFPQGEPATRLERGRAYLKQTRAHVEALHRAGASGLSVCRLIAEATDRLVSGLFAELREELQPPEGLALAAVGGYGRREMAPGSDVDLLLLRSPKAKEEKVRPFAKAFNTLLWDHKLVVGWGVRTPQECASAAEEDHTVRTALLDCRFLTGDRGVFDALTEDVLRELLTHRADAFIADKSQELRARREKFGESIYLLEPNLKQGEGGLRDLEGALWIAQARYRTRGLRQLLEKAVLPASEVQLLQAARDFLLRIRNQMHYARGRKEDRLTFDLQEEVARFLGYVESPDGLPVEQFMRHYYLSAKIIRGAADALIARCEEASPRRGSPGPERRLGPFKTFRGKLTLDGDPETLASHPELLLRLFRVADEEGLALYSWVRDQVVQALPHLHEARGRPEVVEEVKALLARPGTRGDLIFELHDLGVLGAALPEFGRVTALHQHDMYHVYTVDVHSLFALRRLYALRAGDLLEEEPRLSREMQELSDPLPLYLGMMLHDCGKGLGGDHSEKGRQLAAQLGERLNLSPRQREITEFLVLQHLAMSRTSQRRDLSDPELIADFAASCGDVEKLTCLYLLTYADMRSVAPTMWNAWKARLLEELFDKARAHLLGQAAADASGRLSGLRQAFFERWRQAFGEERARALAASLPERYFLATDPPRAVLHGRLLARARRMPLAAALRHHGNQELTELTLAAPDRPGLLALFAGVLSAHGVDILRARIASTEDGLALDVFEVKAPLGRRLDRPRWRNARADLLRVLAGGTTVEEILQKRRPRSILSRPVPKVRTEVSVDSRASQRFSVVDVRAQDRVGLLYAIASSLRKAGLEIALAKVATEANRAVDSFYVTKAGGKVPDAEVPALVAGVHAALEEFGQT